MAARKRKKRKQRKLRVLLLVHDVLVPPPDAEELDWEETWAYQMELDVQQTLRELGHEVEVLGVADDLQPIADRVAKFKPHVAFNILTDFHDVIAYEAHVVSYLELLRQPYTGCNPRGILLANDKALCKQILTWHGVPCPPFTVFSEGVRSARLPSSMQYPVIVKSATQHGSAGLSQASVVHTDKQLQKRVAYMHKKVGGDVIAEQFLPGRELTVSIIGNDRLDAFPVWEVWYNKLPKGNHAIATEQVKWNVEYAQGIGIRTGPARRLAPDRADEIQRIAKAAYRALGLSGYARIDFRTDAQGNPFVIEANVNADLTAIEDFAEAAEAYGYDYGELLQRLLNLGISYQAAWKSV